MAGYKTMYLRLATAQADAIESLNAVQQTLIRAQQEAEELYINYEPIEIVPFPANPTEEQTNP